MRTIVCVRKGQKYTEQDVTALKAQCLEHEPDARFICLSEQDNKCETIPLRHDYPGWWSKLELFSPENEHLRPFLFLDLDTFVLGNFGDMWDMCGNSFWMLEDFYRPNGGQSAMMWIPKNVSHIWDAWIRCPSTHMSNHKGDQGFLETFNFNYIQNVFKGHMSYKVHDLSDSPKGAVTVHFHGKPKAQETTGWALQYWQKYAEL
jgi:hypothetical protein